MAEKKLKKQLRGLFAHPSRNPFTAISILPNGVHFESQNKDEDIYMLMRQHWITNVPWILKTIIALALPYCLIVLSAVYPQLTSFIDEKILTAGFIMWYMSVATFVFYHFIKWYFNVYIVTDERFLDMDFYGLMNCKVSEANLVNVEDVSSSTVGIWETLFNFGNIQIQTAAERNEFIFERVPNPGFVRDKIMDIAEVIKRV